MAYDQPTTERVRHALKHRRDVTEKKMFGGLAFMIRGNMCCGVMGTDLVLRLGEQGATDALQQPHTRPMDFTGKPMKNMVYLEVDGHRSEEELRCWVDRAVEFAGTLPSK